MDKIKGFFSRIKGFFKKIGGYLDKADDHIFPFLHKHMWLIVMVIAFAITLVAKFYAFAYLSGDYTGFLKVWMNKYKEVGLWRGFGLSLGDYTPAYNYFLCIFAQILPESGYVYAIKGFDILFELSFSIATFLIVYRLTKNKNYSALAFVVSLIIPSVIINGAIWGQCDIIFTSFIVWSFYFILKGHSNKAMIFFSIAFAIKLQAIFFLPFIFFLILKRQIKIWQIIYIPLIYILIGLPAVICGRSFSDVMTVYLRQLDEYKKLSSVAPNLYSFFDNGMSNYLISIFVVLFFAITLTYVFYLYYKDIALTADNLITVALISVFFSPFFLPQMHERYFFLADIFAFLYIFIKKKGFVMAFLINFASVTCCCYWVLQNFGGSNFFPHFNVVRLCSCINLVAVIYLIIEMRKLKSNKDIANTCISN